MEKNTKKKARLSHYESQLLYLLVDDFEKSYHNEIAKYPFYDIRRFPRKKYHAVLINHPISRCKTFTSLKKLQVLFNFPM